MELDAAVFAACGWDEASATMPKALVLERLLELNLGREGAWMLTPWKGHPSLSSGQAHSKNQAL